jgi:hypothetical protein
MAELFEWRVGDPKQETHYWARAERLANHAERSLGEKISPLPLPLGEGRGEGRRREGPAGNVNLEDQL